MHEHDIQRHPSPESAPDSQPDPQDKTSFQNLCDTAGGGTRTADLRELAVAIAALNKRLRVTHLMRRDDVTCLVCFRGNDTLDGKVRHADDCELARLIGATASVLARNLREPVAPDGRRVVCGTCIALYGVQERNTLLCDEALGHAGEHCDGGAQLRWSHGCTGVVKHASGLTEYRHAGADPTFSYADACPPKGFAGATHG